MVFDPKVQEIEAIVLPELGGIGGCF